MTKKEKTGRQIISETLRIAWLVQGGAYALMSKQGQLPQDKTINIMLSLALWAFFWRGYGLIFWCQRPLIRKQTRERRKKTGR